MFRECSNLSIISSQGSQYTDGLTPRESDQAGHAQFSPMRKKGKPGRISRMLGTDGENNPSLFNLVTSQDSFLCESQTTYSQEVVNRLGQLTCRQEESLDGFLEDSTSIDAFSLPPTQVKSVPPPPRVNRQSVGGTDFEGEKKVVIAPAVSNPFLPTPPSRIRKPKKPTNIWIQPYKERPRYISDFEEEGVLGEGSYSVVYAARKRLDGVVYAVKKLKIRISSESEGMAMTKEVCALAALKGCPNLVQYFGSWVEDGHLWVQTELCLKVNLDVFVYPTKPVFPSRCEAPENAAFACGPTSGLNISIGGSEEDILPSSYDTSCGSVASEGLGYISADEDGLSRHTSKTSTAPSLESGDVNASVMSMEVLGEGAKLVVITDDVFFRVLLGVCNALAFMHARGMAHLDIRPANIFLAPCSAADVHDASFTTMSPPSSTGSLALASPRVGTGGFNGAEADLTPSSDAGFSFIPIPAPSSCRKTTLGRSLSFREVSVFNPSGYLSQSDQSQDMPPLAPPTVPGLDDMYIRRKRSFSSAIPDGTTTVNTTASTAWSAGVCGGVIGVEDVCRNIASGAWEVKVGDLGLCCRFGDFSSFTEGEGRYCAGELINGVVGSQDFSKADMFSVGATMLEMCTGTPLSGGGDDSCEWHALRDGSLIESVCADDMEGGSAGGKWAHRSLKGYSKDVKKVIRELLHPVNSSRPSAVTMRDFALDTLARNRLSTRLGGGCGDGVDSMENELIRLKSEVSRLLEENKRLRME